MKPGIWSNIRFNSLWKAAQLGSMFLLNLGVARVLRAADSGNFLLQVSNFQLLAMFAGLSLESGIQYQSALAPLNARGLSRFILRYAALAVLPMAAITVLTLVMHWVRPTLPMALFVVYSVLYMTGMLVFRHFSALANGLRSVQAPILLEGFGNLILIALLAGVYFLPGEWGQPLFFQMFYLIPIVTAFVLYQYLARTQQALFSHPNPEPVHFPALYRYTGISFLANMAFMLMYRMDYWWVAAYCPDRQLGNYIQVSKLGQLFFYLPQLMATVVFPDVVQGHDASRRAMIDRLMKNIVAIYAVCVIAFLLIGKWGLALVLGPSFDEVYNTFLLLIPGVFALGGLAILSTYFAGIDRVSVNVQGALVGLGVMLAGDWIFIPQYKIGAAALVSSVAYIASFAYSYNCYRKLTFRLS